MIKFLILMLFVCNTAHCDITALAVEETVSVEKGIILTEKERSDLLNRGWRDRRDIEATVLVSKYVRPSDYVDSKDRGTVLLQKESKNYAFHTVNALNGTTITEHNFSQVVPNTEVFNRPFLGKYGKNLTFVDCNLVNVKTYGDWTIVNSNTAQRDYFETVDGESVIVDSVWISQNSKDVDDGRRKPLGVIE